MADAIADFMDEYKIGTSVKQTTPQMKQGLKEFLAVCEQRKKRRMHQGRAEKLVNCRPLGPLFSCARAREDCDTVRKAQFRDRLTLRAVRSWTLRNVHRRR